MGQEKYEVWFEGIRGLGARKKYLLHEALKSCRNGWKRNSKLNARSPTPKLRTNGMFRLIIPFGTA